MAKIKRFIDIGANLTDPMYQGIYNGSKKHEADLDHVLKRSWNAALTKIIITGGSVDESTKAIELAKTDDRLYATVGCHPTRCSEFESNPGGPENYLNLLKQLIERNKDKVIAIGECGLDYDRTQFCPIETQKKYFNLQLPLAKQFALPLFLHCRNAASDLLEILAENGCSNGVVHSFDGTIDEAKRFIDLGFYIGINGCSLKTGDNLDTVKELPADKILIETDSPWCDIRPSHASYKYISEDNLKVPAVKKEKWAEGCMIKSRNEPCNIRQVLDVLAATRKEDPLELCAQIYNNTERLFFSKASWAVL